MSIVMPVDRCPYCDSPHVQMIAGPRMACRNDNCLSSGPIAFNGRAETAVELWNLAPRREKPYQKFGPLDEMIPAIEGVDCESD